MNLDTALKKNESLKQPRWLTLFRVTLGLILFWKGITFIHDSTALETMVQKTGINVFNKNATIIAFVITYAHLLGGFLIAVGLFTRLVSALQIPFLVCAIWLVNVKTGMRLDNYELILSIIVLILLIVFVIKGSGILSADEYFRNYYKAGYESGHTGKLFD